MHTFTKHNGALTLIIKLFWSKLGVFSFFVHFFVLLSLIFGFAFEQFKLS